MTDDVLRIDARPYRGLLSPEMLAEGMTNANANAARLLADADTLLAAGRYPTAAALAMTAVEEMAKEDILRALASWPAEAKVFWSAFRDHARKGDLGSVAFLDANVSPVEWLAQVVQTPTGVFGRRMEIARWRALYVDCIEVDGAAVWWSPAAFDAEEARRTVELARRLVGARVVTVDEVRILMKHMTPVAGATWARSIAPRVTTCENSSIAAYVPSNRGCAPDSVSIRGRRKQPTRRCRRTRPAGSRRHWRVTGPAASTHGQHGGKRI